MSLPTSRLVISRGFAMTKILKALVLASIAGLCSGWVSADQQLMQRYDTEMVGISRSRIGIEQKIEKLELEYDRIFAGHGDELSKLNDDDLLAMFKSANMMASYTLFFHTERNRRFLTAMEASFSEMKHRGPIPARIAPDMSGAYIAARRFADANRVIAASEDIGIAPLQDDIPREDFVESQPGAFSIDAATGRVRLENFNTTSGDVIVVVAGCHFSRDAAQDIQLTPTLRAAFGKARTLWLAPADRQFDLNEIRAWNREFPASPMLVAYSHAPWKGVDFSQIPNFYFYRDGKLIAQHAGWKKGSPPKKVIDALREMRLLE